MDAAAKNTKRHFVRKGAATTIRWSPLVNANVNVKVAAAAMQCRLQQQQLGSLSSYTTISTLCTCSFPTVIRQSDQVCTPISELPGAIQNNVDLTAVNYAVFYIHLYIHVIVIYCFIERSTTGVIKHQITFTTISQSVKIT